MRVHVFTDTDKLKWWKKNAQVIVHWWNDIRYTLFTNKCACHLIVNEFYFFLYLNIQQKQMLLVELYLTWQFDQFIFFYRENLSMDEKRKLRIQFTTHFLLIKTTGVWRFMIKLLANERMEQKKIIRYYLLSLHYRNFSIKSHEIDLCIEPDTCELCIDRKILRRCIRVDMHFFVFHLLFDFIFSIGLYFNSMDFVCIYECLCLNCGWHTICILLTQQQVRIGNDSNANRIFLMMNFQFCYISYEVKWKTEHSREHLQQFSFSPIFTI